MDSMEYVAKFVGFTTIILITAFTLWLLFWFCAFAYVFISDWIATLRMNITCWWEDRKGKRKKEKENK